MDIYNILAKERVTNMLKSRVCTAIGLAGSIVTTLIGGWDKGMVTLITCMAVDYITGLMVAGVFHKSQKSETGGLESKAGWKGLCRKAVTLLFVMVAYRLDMLIGTDYIRDAVIIGFVANEVISIVENAGLMGIPLPSAITKAIDILQTKADSAKGEQ